MLKQSPKRLCVLKTLVSCFAVSNVCQNGLSPGGAVTTDGNGVVSAVNLPAVPLPESVARSLSSTGVPGFNSGTPARQQQPPGQPAPVTSSGPAPVAAAAAAAPTPKPLYRPFAISPPPSAKTTPTTTTAPPLASVPPQISSSLASQYHSSYHNPFFPAATGTYNPYYPGTTTGPSPYNGLFTPPQHTTPSSTLATHTVPASHHDLTCKSHLPKLAHALTTTSARTPQPSLATPLSAGKPSSYPSLPLNDPANLRRELDNRYLHDRNLAGALRPPQFMRADHLAPPLRPPSNQSSSYLPLVSSVQS